MSMSTFLRRPGRGPKLVSDVEPGSEEQTGFGIVECLRVKGFCLITDFLPESLVADVNEIMPGLGAWKQPAYLVQQGLLGEEGSNRILRVPMLDSAAEPPPGDALMGLDAKMWQISKAITRFQGDMGLSCNNRSETLLHEANSSDFSEVDLVDKEADEWLGCFMCHRVLILIFLGPGPGTLELQPIFNEEADPVELKTVPGLVVVVRTDQLSYRYYSKGSDRSYVASSFLMDASMMRKRGKQFHINPAAAELEEWIYNRMREIKDSEPEEPEWVEIEAPRAWVSMANRMFFKQQVVDLCSTCCRLPSSWDADIFCISAMFQGADTVMEVPYHRWDHDVYYSAEPGSFQDAIPKTDCKHGAFVDGLELFDHKYFGIGPAEVKDMDPGQRVALEVTYEALHANGWRKVPNASSAVGMFVGIGTSEWAHAERKGLGISTAAFGAASICAGRLSFALGCKGPSVAIDTDQASSLTAVWWACESIQHKGKGSTAEFSCGIGVHMVLAQIMWLAKSQRGDFSPIGRCRNFDHGADGFVVADGVGCGVLRRKSKVVDGQEVVDDGPIVGSIVGGASNNSGRSSALSTPHGTSMQEVIIDALVASSIMPADVEIIECHGSAKTAGDYIESIAAATALRNWLPEEQGVEGVLNLTSSKTNLGNSIEMAGLTSLVKAMYSIKWGIIMANLHLKQLNRHLDMNDRRCETLAFATEHVEQGCNPADSKVFAGVTAFGWGGTNVHLQVFGGIDETLRPMPESLPEEANPRITYWPGGGGDLDRTSRPKKGYFIVGTFNNWAQGLPMEFQGEGCHACVVELGENRWEQFAILIDNDPAKVLHPRQYKAPRGTEVVGPEEIDGHESTWLLDGRSYSEAGPGADDDEGGPQRRGSEGVQNLLAGAPGDRYRIRLHVAGKWRTVSWTKLESAAALPAESQALAALGSAARYSVHCGWDDFAGRDMEPDPSVPGRFSVDIPFECTGQLHFYIVRNGDWSQSIFPAGMSADADCRPIYGPDDMGGWTNYQWCIRGRTGDIYKIEFQRNWQDGEDKMHIQWRRL